RSQPLTFYAVIPVPPCSLPFPTPPPCPPSLSTLSLHDALPISHRPEFDGRHSGLYEADGVGGAVAAHRDALGGPRRRLRRHQLRSEEHTSELQSRRDLVCRLLLEKKKNN